MIASDDEFLAIEMTIVSSLFCLDFGGAYLDEPPDYSDEVWADWREYKSNLLEDNWSAVEEILAVFRSFGIYIADMRWIGARESRLARDAWIGKLKAGRLKVILTAERSATMRRVH